MDTDTTSDGRHRVLFVQTGPSKCACGKEPVDSFVESKTSDFVTFATCDGLSVGCEVSEDRCFLVQVWSVWNSMCV